MMMFFMAALILRPFVKAENTEGVECYVSVQGINGDFINGKASGKNALEIVKKVLEQYGFSYTMNDNGTFSRIYDLAETDGEKWQYSIKNGNDNVKTEVKLEDYIPKEKDEITVYFAEVKEDKPSVIKEEESKPVNKLPAQCIVRVEGLNSTIISGKADGDSALDIVKKVLDYNKVKYTLDNKGNIKGISNLVENQAEFWKFYIKKSNSVVMPKTSLEAYVPDNQDEIILYYTDSKVKYLTSASISTNAGGGYKLKFLSDGNGIQSALVTIDKKNYITNENGEIGPLDIPQGTHTYMISGYNCGKLSTVVMDQGTIFADGKNLPQFSYTSPNSDGSINFYNETIAAANAVKDYSDPFAYVSLNKLQTGKNEDYLNAAVKHIKNSGVDSLSNSDLESLIIALTADGYNYQNFAGSNLGSILFSRNIDTFRTDELVDALITMNYANIPNGYKINRGIIIEKLLNKVQTGDSKYGWGLGNSADPYITGTVLSALAPFKNMESVKSAIENAVKSLESCQNINGYIAGYNGITSESTASVITGLISVGVNPEGITIFDDGTKVNFAKENGSLITAMMSFKGYSGFYKHILDGGNNLKATEECLRALISIYNYKSSGYAYDYFVSEIDPSNLKKYPIPADSGEETQPGNNGTGNGNSSSNGSSSGSSSGSGNGNVKPTSSGDGNPNKENSTDTGKESVNKKVQSSNKINISIGGLILLIGAIGVASQAINLNRRE